MRLSSRSLFFVTAFCLSLCMGTNLSFAADPVALKWGHIYPVSSEIHGAVILADNLVRQRSNGKLKIEIFPGEQLGSSIDEVENTKIGTQDLAMTWGGAVPLLSPIQIV